MLVIITWEQQINMSEWVIRVKIMDQIDEAYKMIQKLKDFEDVVRRIRWFSASEMNL